MICFPLDNTEYEANALGAWCGTRTRGVFAADSHFTVTANGDMTVTVGMGISWLKADTFWGTVAFETNPQVLTLDTADGSLARIDAICVRLDKNRNLGELIVKKGSYTPQPPTIAAPVRNLDYDEIYVATIRVRAGATSILATDITDQRLNETYCGVMRDGVTGIPTQGLYDAWWAWFSSLQLDTEEKAAAFTAWMAAFKYDNETELAAWLSNFKTTSQADFEMWFTNFKTGNSTIYYNWYNAFKTESETDFNSWFQNLQNQLDDNQAANLQNQIDQHKATLASAAGGVHGIRYLDGKLQIDLGDGWATLAEVVRGLRSTYIDALGMTSFEIDALQYTSTQIDNLIERED